MKSLIKKPMTTTCCVPAQEKGCVPAHEKVAQCCAKVSKNVAGCHD
jgi:hypothetical protein